jgi:hypothetical protein
VQASKSGEEPDILQPVSSIVIVFGTIEAFPIADEFHEKKYQA